MSNGSHTATGETLIYLIRHGETDWNNEHRFQGQLDIPLNARGIKQAEALARWLEIRYEYFTAIYSSDLSRALQTATVIGTSIGLVPIRTPDLREVNCGDWQGLLAVDVEQRFPGQLDAWRREVDMAPMRGGESLREVQRRTYKLFLSAVQRHMGEAIILVTHGAALATLLAAINGWNLEETWRNRTARSDNTGVTLVTFSHDTGTYTPRFINSLQHLVTPGQLQPEGEGTWPA